MSEQGQELLKAEAIIKELQAEIDALEGDVSSLTKIIADLEQKNEDLGGELLMECDLADERIQDFRNENWILQKKLEIKEEENAKLKTFIACSGVPLTPEIAELVFEKDDE